MKILRGIAVAFSMYSRIPMPVFEWKEDDMSRGLMFFPLVGAIIGGLAVGVYYLTMWQQWPKAVVMCLLGLLPVMITGGFHIDGYMDMTDALRSYQPKEKKLEILKDPHIGAFAVIGLLGVMLTYGAGLGMLTDRWNLKAAISYGLIFVISRCFSGISSIVLKKAKKDGMLHEETKINSKLACGVLIAQLVIADAILLYINLLTGILMLVGMIGVLIYYERVTDKQFGGVTGDTAGYLVTVSETVMVVILGVATWYGL